MKAIRIHEYGDVGVLRYEDAERPRPGPGEVLVRVAATAFNPVDTWFRSGVIDRIFPVRFPHTLGLDVAGTIAETGAGVRGLGPGDAVIGFLPMTGPGAAADYVAAPATVLAPAPAGIPLADAAAIPVAALTAWQALFEHGGLVPGQRVLINGAGGGVGGFAVQLARRAGAVVVATASPRSAAAVRAFGATEIIDYTTVKVADAMAEPADLTVNLVAGSRHDTESLIGVTRPGGVVVSATYPGDDVRGSGVRVAFFSVRSDASQLARIAALVAAGELRLDITGRRPLADTPAVHQQSEAGAIRGRVILIPEGSPS
jgi:NADPH:quinone reductase-like Zn-dependent oxidoreductase